MGSQPRPRLLRNRPLGRRQTRRHRRPFPLRKATAVAMAYDSRFAIAFVSSSGEGGVKIHRRNWGELVENVAATSEYHWMAGNFLKYAGTLNWNDLPVDSHELGALCAPRPVF